MSRKDLMSTGGGSSSGYASSGFILPNASVSGTATSLMYGQLVGTDKELIDPCVLGHVVSSEHIEYFDGLVVSNCRVCGVRIMLARVPGGISTLKLKAFLGAVMGLDLSEEEDADFRLSDLLSYLNELRSEVAQEASALRRANSMIDLAAQMLQQRIEANNASI